LAGCSAQLFVHPHAYTYVCVPIRLSSVWVRCHVI
jgi:hypothetical protein